MKYKITRFTDADIQFLYDDKEVYLTEKNPTITITDDEFIAIPPHKRYLIENGFVLVERIEDEEEKVDIKKKK